MRIIAETKYINVINILPNVFYGPYMNFLTSWFISNGKIGKNIEKTVCYLFQTALKSVIKSDYCYEKLQML